ncbi:MAG TPA: DUF998 domain-containing protein [Acidimicrobiales bacterium]|jgi:hypothetical membrane protein|nr:DUF998 domain-containing protein [Acidimicrobiales bacterium]
MRHIGTVATLGGVIGPAAFVSGWAVVGSNTPHFSSTREAISQLARIGAPHRWLMTVAFFAFGLGLLAFAPLLARQLHAPLLRVAVSVAALGALGVAAFPLGVQSGGIGDQTHVFWAVVGYVGTSGAPLVAGWTLRKSNPTLGAVSVAVGLLSAGALIGSGFSSIPGFWQRTGLGVVDLWFITIAVWMLRQRRPNAPVAGA